MRLLETKQEKRMLFKNRPVGSAFSNLTPSYFCFEDPAGGGNDPAGGTGDPTNPGNKGGTGGDTAALLAEIKAMRAEVAALKAAPKPKGPEGDPTLDEIQRGKKAQEKQQADQERVITAAKFNMRFETFLKEYAGVLPPSANEIPKVATVEKHPNELDRSAAIKSALMISFFAEEKNLDLLTESQKAKWKQYTSLGTVGRGEEAASIYEVVFEPAVNQARATRQAQIKSKEDPSSKGSSDSDIIMRKVHEKQLRAISTNYKLNDVLHEQAKALGLVGAQT